MGYCGAGQESSWFGAKRNAEPDYTPQGGAAARPHALARVAETSGCGGQSPALFCFYIPERNSASPVCGL